MYHAYYNNKDEYSILNITIKYKLKGVSFFILNCGFCFLYLLATLLVITFPIFSAFLHTHVCMAK